MRRYEIKAKGLKRLVLINQFENVEAEVSTFRSNEYSQEIVIEGDRYFSNEAISSLNTGGTVYNFPILLNEDGSPFHEANLYFLDKVLNEAAFTIDQSSQRTDGIRREASILLEYKIFCEVNDLDYLDLSGNRVTKRPPSKYFKFLCSEVEQNAIGAETLNQHTKVVHDFYEFLDKEKIYGIDASRVDVTKGGSFFYEDDKGFSRKKDYVKRSQTLPTSKKTIPLLPGYVSDEGEELRPLSQTELDMLLEVLKRDEFSQDERLICYVALYTGARKQTILTMRRKHLSGFSEGLLLPDHTYLLMAGTGNGIDTKYGKTQDLYFPKDLAERLKVFANSESSQALVEKFKNKNPSLFEDDDVYLFLSAKGECHYHAKSDPRYKKRKTLNSGKKANEICKKIIALTPDEFPNDFTFHWLRATFAYRYYLTLLPQLASGTLRPGDEITKVQRRLHHVKRSTSENYLKLFLDIDDRMKSQNMFEDILFGDFEKEVGFV